MLAERASHLSAFAISARNRLLAPTPEDSVVDLYRFARQHVDPTTEFAALRAELLKRVAPRAISAPGENDLRVHVSALVGGFSARARAVAHGDECDLSPVDPCDLGGSSLEPSKDPISLTRQGALDPQLGPGYLGALQTAAGAGKL